MKLFKKLASLVTAATLALSFCAFGTACKPDDNTVDAYVFNVENVNGRSITVQLCVYAEDGVTQTSCFNHVAVDENGKCVYTPDGFPGEGAYAIHVFENKSIPVEFDGPQSTEATYGEYTLILK